MLKKIQQILQPQRIFSSSSSSLSSQVEVEVQHKLKVNSVARSVVYSLTCICLFAFREDIKAGFYFLSFSVATNFLVDVVVDFITTMLLVHIVGSFIESLIKNLQSSRSKVYNQPQPLKGYYGDRGEYSAVTTTPRCSSRYKTSQL